MELPSRAELLRNAFIFGAIGCLPVLSTSWASSSVGIGFAASLFTLYNRGAPDTNEMSAEMRPPKVRLRTDPNMCHPWAVASASGKQALACESAFATHSVLMTLAFADWQVRPLALAAGITVLAGALGATLSQLIFGSVRFLAQESVIGLCTSFFFFLTASLFKVQDDWW
jgi:hypothetical protein